MQNIQPFPAVRSGTVADDANVRKALQDAAKAQAAATAALRRFEFWDQERNAHATVPGMDIPGLRWNGTDGFVAAPFGSRMRFTAQNGIAGARGVDVAMPVTGDRAIGSYGRYGSSGSPQGLEGLDDGKANISARNQSLLGLPSVHWNTGASQRDIVIGEIPATAEAGAIYQFVYVMRLPVDLTSLRLHWRNLATFAGNSATNVNGTVNRGYMDTTTGVMVSYGHAIPDNDFGDVLDGRVIPLAGQDHVVILNYRINKQTTPAADAPAGVQQALFLADRGSNDAGGYTIAPLYAGPRLWSDTELAALTADDVWPRPTVAADPSERTITTTESFVLPATISVVAARPTAPSGDTTLIEATDGSKTVRLRHRASGELQLQRTGETSLVVAAERWSTTLAEAVTLHLDGTTVTVLVNGIARLSAPHSVQNLSEVSIGGRADQSEPFTDEIVMARVHGAANWVPVLPALDVTQADYDGLVPVRGRIYRIVA